MYAVRELIAFRSCRGTAVSLGTISFEPAVSARAGAAVDAGAGVEALWSWPRTAGAATPAKNSEKVHFRKVTRQRKTRQRMGMAFRLPYFRCRQYTPAPKIGEYLICRGRAFYGPPVFPGGAATSLAFSQNRKTRGRDARSRSCGGAIKALPYP